MSDNKIEILTPVGRIVGGDCFEGQTKDAEGRPLVIKTGPNAGQPRTSFYIGLAIAKTDPAWPELWAKLIQAAQINFPTLFDAAGNCVNPQFAYKVTDGDSTTPNTKGKKPCDREGYPGHWVVNFSNGFAPTCYNAGGKELITDPNAIKRGYYARVYANIDGNESMQQPGIYLNHTMVELIGYGEEIHTGPSGEQIFGGHPVAGLPAGASATPLAPNTTIAPGPGTGPGGPVTNQSGPGAAMGPGAGPGGPAANTSGPAPGPGAGPSAPAPDYLNPQQAQTYTVNGATWTAEQLRASGWTDQQIAGLTP